ncbi:MAG: non-canonical purine NTP pyrophosphatase [Candidatus Marsarchaeota archaeon]|nr:non-canonical purine NTP pyrophosphatase [Candidatus Marsarchaeota archaeon]
MGVLFATSNTNKLREARAVLGFKIDSLIIEFEEIQSLSEEEVARKKVVDAYNISHAPVIIEDTGLHISGLGGFPGALIKWLIKGLGYEGICRLADLCGNRKAYGETCIAFYDGRAIKTFSGRVNGSIAPHPKGRRKFGWDYIFIPKGHKRTFAEMTISEKNRISMRSKAFKKARRFLEDKGYINNAQK